jgi:hypothetical protein
MSLFHKTDGQVGQAKNPKEEQCITECEHGSMVDCGGDYHRKSNRPKHRGRSRGYLYLGLKSEYSV